jgi:DNA phosphorothioation-associated putative methyltransferase
VERDRTALHRTTLSRPVTRAVTDELISETTTVLDYGCGRGGDVARLRRDGIPADGFDPVFFPATRVEPADLVNLGYVVNVIEDQQERARTLKRAWDLTRSVLVVSARLRAEEKALADCARRHGDGLITNAATFQKFYSHEELRDWVEEITGVHPVAAEPGMFYVFRQPADAEVFMLWRRRRVQPRVRKSDVVFSEHQELLGPLMRFVEEQGRLPKPGELTTERELLDKVGTIRQAFQIVKHATGEERWDRIRLSRYEELLVHMALSRFHRRPRMSDLPRSLQLDIKDFFGSYKAACEQGERALFAIGAPERRTAAMDSAEVGKRTRSALYVHTSAVDQLPVGLRVLEGVARELLGTVSDGTLIKIDRERPRVSYLDYPAFEEEPHPALRSAYLADLSSLRTDFLDYSRSENPPILHRKELFVDEHHPKREMFERLTRQEQRAGLFRDTRTIGRQRGWEDALERGGVALRGHRLVPRV